MVAMCQPERGPLRFYLSYFFFDSAPPTSQVSHFTAEGVGVFRLPFGWQYMQSNGLGTTINAGFFSEYNALVQAVISAGAIPILDLHNYARWNGGIVGQGGPTNANLENVWTQLATYYASSRVIFGLMNEPYSLDMTEWAATCQGVINAIRAAGATSQIILIPGTEYTSAGAFPDDSYSYLAGITDPAHSGSTELLYFDVHQYLDSTYSGTATTCTTNAVGGLEALNSLLAGAGRYAFLSETGGGSTSSCESDLGQELAYIKSAGQFKGFTAWAAGSFATASLRIGFALTLG
ncbi:MAG: hypothetical protein CYPHOPRED_004475 [Cyphobasidiales sp. Tagirdzhanova-0007]|nr:MAG: hypothetical protein CYPHOPRED_004475 [Cyphobasidiales sp. Tagirdzhanova-0007]